MFLEQIERKQARMIEERDARKSGATSSTAPSQKPEPRKPLMRSVPSSEITPEKGLTASSYLGEDRRPSKTMGLKLSARTHDRIEAVRRASKKYKHKKDVVERAIELGLQALEK